MNSKKEEEQQQQQQQREIVVNGDCYGNGGVGCRRRRRRHDASCVSNGRSYQPAQQQQQRQAVSCSFSFWNAYKKWVYRHEAKLYWMDEGISRLLWWIPTTTTSSSSSSDDAQQQQQQQQHSHRWPREVIWGLLQLHRLFVDLALEEKQQQETHSQSSFYDGQRGLLHNGTTLRLSHHQDDDGDVAAMMSNHHHSPIITSHRLRIGLDIIQSLRPVAQELVVAASASSGGGSTASLDTRRRQAAVGLFLERIRFVMRLYFLVKYWRQWKRQQPQSQEQETTTTFIPPGIMQRGGLLTTSAAAASSSGTAAPTVEQERARLERVHYVGRRTGRRVVGSIARVPAAPTATSRASDDSNESLLSLASGCCKQRIKLLLSSLLSAARSANNKSNNNKATMMRLVVGELLYIFRPLFWAQAQWDGYNHEHAVQQMATAASAAAGVSNPIIGHDTDSSSSSSSHSSKGGRRSLAWLWKAWLISLGMDITSLMSLSCMAATTPSASTDGGGRSRNGTSNNNNINISNPATVQEWKRRRLRLLLYLLRSPMWETYTERFTGMDHNGGDRLSRHVPLVGGLLAAYLQDWLYYWKDYRAEEG